MSEQQQYYEACQRHFWASKDASKCGCGASGWRGWWLSDLDTWHQCPFHGAGVPHPDSYEEDEPDETAATPAVEPPQEPPQFTIEWGDDDIPF